MGHGAGRLHEEDGEGVNVESGFPHTHVSVPVEVLVKRKGVMTVETGQHTRLVLTEGRLVKMRATFEFQSDALAIMKAWEWSTP